MHKAQNGDPGGGAGEQPPKDAATVGRLIPVEEVASILGISVRFVWRLAASGELERPIKLGRARRWMYGDVLAYIQKLKDDRDRGSK